MTSLLIILLAVLMYYYKDQLIALFKKEKEKHDSNQTLPVHVHGPECFRRPKFPDFASESEESE